MIESRAEMLATTSLNAVLTMATSYGPLGVSGGPSMRPALTSDARAASRRSGATMLRVVEIATRRACTPRRGLSARR